MAPARRRIVAFSVFLGAGCSLDFTVRPDPGDAGSPPADAGDAAIDSSPPVDASDADAVIVADADGGPDCDALAKEVAAKRDAARKCTLASGQCMSTVKDQCECDVVIAVGGSPAAASFEEAAKRYKTSGCTLGCSTCTTPTNKNCLQTGSDVSCFP